MKAMNRKIAIPISDGLLDPHFGHCQQFALVEVIDKQAGQVSYLDAPPHEPGKLPRWLADHGATDVIAGGMGQRAIQLFEQRGVKVTVGAARRAPEELVAAFLSDSLDLAANRCDH